MKEQKTMITMELEGRKIRVPEGLTVIEALWDTGHELNRGIGCLSGLCGACTVAFLEAGAQRVKFGLGCQVVVEEGMNVIMLPYFPSRVARYDMKSLEDPLGVLSEMYPELYSCNDCKACNICPEWIDVAGVMKKAKEEDFFPAAERVMDCHMCGLCASRCPKSIAPQFVGLYIQRSCARQRPIPANLQKRLKEVESLKNDEEFGKILTMSDEALRDFCRKTVEG